MSDEQKQDLTQQAEDTTEQVAVPQQADDLTSRVSGVSLEQSEPKDVKFDRNQFTDQLSKLPPEMQEQVRLFQQSIYKGADDKFQEAARLRQEAEQLRQRGWDKNSVQEVLNDPTFQSNIQQLQNERQSQQNPEGSGLSDEEWSYLSPKEKNMLFETRKAQMEQSRVFNAYMQKQEYEKQDSELKTRFKNYDNKKVDETFNGLLSGQLQATREHLWKVIDYDDAVKRAYQLGKKDHALDLNEKVQAVSPGAGLNITKSSDVPAKGDKESGIEYFKRLALQNAKKLGVKI